MEQADIIDEDEMMEKSTMKPESEADKDKGQDVKKIIAMGKPKPFEKKILDEYTPFDVTSFTIMDRVEKRKEKAPKTFIEKEEEKKEGIERRLEDSDKALNELVQLGDELVTNIQIANEKREVLRRNFEALKREDLLADLEKESLEAMAKFVEITAKWTELEAIKEPVGLSEGLAIQKNRIEELMKQKEDAIRQCQEEIKRVDAKYNDDLERQSADIYCLVERIDNQMENMRKAFKSHIELLQDTIENERETLALTAARKWEELYQKRAENEKMKLLKENEKEAFYAAEIARITLEHEELTRATRIRLEKDAEALQLELRNVKNNVLLNSEKLDYNYQVLQKVDDENAITVNQQKRRLAKLNEIVSTLKKKIRETKSSSNSEIKKLSTEVMHLHSCIVELESKTENFSILDDKKYQTVWEVNLSEATTLLNKILDIDRILHEQQLGLPWTKPDLPVFKIKDFVTLKEDVDTKHFDMRISKPHRVTLKIDPFKEKDRRTDEQKLAHTRLMRTILRKIADRGGFLLEEKLLEILKPYSENQQALVKIDNIFNALGITQIEDVSALVHFFVPYAWCPNCSTGLPQSVINRLHQIELEQFQSKDVDSAIYDELSEKTTVRDADSSVKSEKTQSSHEETSEVITKDEENPMDDLMKEFDKKDMVLDRRKSVQFEEKVIVEEKTDCPNHYLVIEPAFVLTALREFAEKHLCGILPPGMSKVKSAESLRSRRRNLLNKAISKTDVETFWHQFNNIFPEHKVKVWQNLEHGLNHYLKVLKERVKLDSECEFLRKQNAELRYLLQQYLPPDKCVC